MQYLTISIYLHIYNAQLVTLDTETMGRLGLAVCADIMWAQPTVELAVKEQVVVDISCVLCGNNVRFIGQVDTLLLPLSWWDLFPHQLAHSNEDAWARGLQVIGDTSCISRPSTISPSLPRVWCR